MLIFYRLAISSCRLVLLWLFPGRTSSMLIRIQVPSNIFLAQLRPSIYIPCCMAGWGIISTCTGAVQNAGGLYAARFMLGFVEACFYPGAIFLLSSWYRRSELGTRCAFLYSGSQIGSAFSGLIAAGITSGLDGSLGLRAWRWIFVSHQVRFLKTKAD